MPFLPRAGDTLVIDHVEYHFAEHPAAEGMPYGQEGRAAVVYQLSSEQGKSAIKVFKPRFRRPSLVALSDRIGRFATLPGMHACARTVVTARRHADLLQEHPDLTYSVLMPWIDGPTWTEVLLEKTALSPESSLSIARALAELLAGLEEQGLAHCDLSGPNVLIPALASSKSTSGLQAVELVDMEQLFGPGLERPEVLLSGTMGYAPRYAGQSDLWGAKADRFAGAVLIAEMLGWCDEAVRDAAWGESYFDPDEVQQPGSANYRVLVEALRRRWGNGPASLFADAWRSETLEDCPTFGEWLVKLPRPATAAPQGRATPVAVAPSAAVISLIETARQLETQGSMEGALESYRQALQAATPGSGIAQELALIVASIQAKLGQPPQTGAGQTAQAPQVAQAGQAAQTAPPAPPKPLSDLDRLFNFGLAAYNRGEWRGAQEMFREVVRLQPDYASEGQFAAVLLADVDKRVDAQNAASAAAAAAAAIPATTAGAAAISEPQPSPVASGSRTDSAQPAQAAAPPPRTVVDVKPGGSNRMGLIGGLLGLLVVLALGAFFLMQNRPAASLQAVTDPTATVQPTEVVAQVDAGATASAEAEVQADMTAEAEAQEAADATATAEELALLVPTETQPASTPTTAAGPAVTGSGQVTFRDNVLPSDQVVITLDPAPSFPRGTGIYGWFTDSSTGAAVRVGRLLPDADNKVSLVYSAPGNANLVGLYDGFKVTAEDVEAQPETPSDQVLLVGQLPPEATMHIRHLLVGDAALPNQASVSTAMRGQLDQVRQRAEFMRDHQAGGNLVDVKLHAEAIVNIIDGVKGLYYGDLDKNGEVVNPGDGVGLLVGNDEVGYIQHTIDHADKSSSLPDASEEIKMHAGHVMVSSENVRGWITTIRDLSLQVAAAPDLTTTKPLSDEILALANRAINGQPWDAEGQVLPVPGSGGAITAYQHSQLMAAIQLAPPGTEGTGMQTNEAGPTPTDMVMP